MNLVQVYTLPIISRHATNQGLIVGPGGALLGSCRRFPPASSPDVATFLAGVYLYITFALRWVVNLFMDLGGLLLLSDPEDSPLENLRSVCVSKKHWE